MRTEPTPANSVLSTQYSVPRVALVTGSGKRRVGWYVADALALRGSALSIHHYTSAREAEDAVAHFGGPAEARPYPDYAAYFASKAAIPALTRCLAVELGTRNPNVRVNCILPGPVLFQPDLPEAEKQQAIRATLVQHAGSPENIAQA